jgi:hypothetical protein
MVRMLKEMLRPAVDHRQHVWSHHLAASEFAYNNAIHASTQLTSFELDTGHHPKVPYWFLFHDTPSSVKKVDEFVDDLEALQLQAVDFLEHARQSQAKEVNKGRPRPKILSVGEFVMLNTQYVQPAFMRATARKKLRAKYIDPFSITKWVSPTSYELDLPANFRVHPVINIQYLKEFHPNPARFVGRLTDPRNNRLSTDDTVESTLIEEIRDHRETRLGFFQYLCHYKETADHDDVWELVDEVNRSESGQRAMTRYWNDFYKWQAKETTKEKKPRKARKKKWSGDDGPRWRKAPERSGDNGSHWRRSRRAGISDRVEEDQTVTNNIVHSPANGDTASIDLAIGMLYNDHPASQNTQLPMIPISKVQRITLWLKLVISQLV